MDRGDLPFRYIGKHRRASLKDVLALNTELDVRQKAMEDLAADLRISISIMAFSPVVAIYDACIL
jgi:hypothetical protein